jgi:hypothetical protein
LRQVHEEIVVTARYVGGEKEMNKKKEEEYDTRVGWIYMQRGCWWMDENAQTTTTTTRVAVSLSSTPSHH